MEKITNTLKVLVKKEADNLKKFATKEEISRLDITELVANDTESCLYGQATGNCSSPRAIDLITKCCTRVYDVSSGTVNNPVLNGKPSRKKRGEWYSPIELFIHKELVEHSRSDTQNNAALISYLKDETKELVIS